MGWLEEISFRDKPTIAIDCETCNVCCNFYKCDKEFKEPWLLSLQYHHCHHHHSPINNPTAGAFIMNFKKENGQITTTWVQCVLVGAHDSK
jgi:hypothetical protein